jgi:hypothetical protein
VDDFRTFLVRAMMNLRFEARDGFGKCYTPLSATDNRYRAAVAQRETVPWPIILMKRFPVLVKRLLKDRGIGTPLPIL